MRTHVAHPTALLHQLTASALPRAVVRTSGRRHGLQPWMLTCELFSDPPCACLTVPKRLANSSRHPTTSAHLVCVCLCLCAVHLSAKAQGASQPFLVSPEEGLEFTVSEGLLGSKGLGLVVKTMKKGARAHLVLQPACEWRPSVPQASPGR